MKTCWGHTPSMGILEQFRLDGKLALVTGCTQGLGMSMAIALAEAGADIVGASKSLESSGSSIEAEIAARNRRFKAYRCDFSNRKNVYAFLQKVNSELPPIDILINNAGMILRAPAVAFPDDYWDQTIEVNLNAQFILAREIGKQMIARRAGKIIFVASLLTFQGGVTVPAYAASKGAVGQLAKALANEWASMGVQVNAIAPGYIRTHSTVALQEDANRNSAILARIPAGRWGEPEDLRGAALFLASAASNYVNGSILTVDGGWMAR
jgi:2-deoxy-D-gluconate 3-dehydrogenase